MKRYQKRINPLIMVFKVFILLFAVIAIPATASGVQVPDMPTIMQGSVVLDGEPAPYDTEISVEIDGVIATVKVTTVGEYKNLPVSDLSVGISYINFYVNGIEAVLVDPTVLNDVVIGTVLKNVNIIATSPFDDGTGDDGTGDDGTGDDGTGDDGTGDDGTGDDGTGDDGTGDDGTGDDGTGDDGTGDDGTGDDGTGDDGTGDDGTGDDGTGDDGTGDDGTGDDGTGDDGTGDDGTGDDGTGDDGTGDDGTGDGNTNTRSGGSRGSYTIKAITAASDEEKPVEFIASITDDTSLKSTATTTTTQPVGSLDVVPESETKSSMMVIVIGAIILLGIVVTIGYKLKEN